MERIYLCTYTTKGETSYAVKNGQNLKFIVLSLSLSLSLSLCPRQEAQIAEREEAWNRVEQLAIQSPDYQKLARPEVITAKMVFPRLEPMETLPERHHLPPTREEVVGVGPGMGVVGPGMGVAGPGMGVVGPGMGVAGPGMGVAGPGMGMAGPGMGVAGAEPERQMEVGTSEGVGVVPPEGMVAGEEGESVIHNVGDGEQVELEVQVDEVSGECVRKCVCEYKYSGTPL